MSKKIKNYMSPLPQTIGVGGNLHLAKMIMEEVSCHHLPVLNGGHLAGVISYSDLNLFLMTTKGKTSLVQDVMTKDPYIVDSDADVKIVAAEMLEQKLSSAIVQAKGNQPWGIFTTTDALKIVAEG